MTSIRQRLSSAGCLHCRFLWGATTGVAFADLLGGSCLSCPLDDLRGRSILLTTSDQLAAALALIELDGVAARIVICPPEITLEYFPALIAKAAIDTVVSDYALPNGEWLSGLRCVTCTTTLSPAQHVPESFYPTEWVLLTSGTTGVPKMIVHSLASLTAPIKAAPSDGAKVVWGTFYDIRRYGGLQVFLRAMMAGGSLVLSSVGEPTSEHLARLAQRAVTHLSGTPSHWRRTLMSPNAGCIAPSYVRLSGEIVEQPILNALRSYYPSAAIGHAFASTEAGVAFEVNDGLAGFPAAILNSTPDVEMKVCNNSLWIRSNRAASRYLDGGRGALADAEGFIDTADMMELRDDRYYFLGRRNRVINVGGYKVYPEEVEAVINRHPAVWISVVRPRRNPITGSLVAADIMLKEVSPPNSRGVEIKKEILDICRQSLADHKIPVILRYVSSLEVAAAGKLVRHHA